MKLYKHKNQLLIIFLVVGFLLGIIYENLIAKDRGTSIYIFQSYFLNQYSQIEIVAEEYFWYLLPVRIIPIIVLCIFGCTRWRKAAVSCWILWTGFLSGILTVAAIMQLGMKGILFCMAGFLPQGIFYGMVYYILLSYLYQYPEKEWNITKTVFIVLMTFLGVVSETYLNPMLIRVVIKFII